MADHTSTTTQRRLRILSEAEITALYGLPLLTDDERLEYFALAPAEKAALEQLHSIPSQLYFMLQLGYFKSHQMFFVFTFAEVAEDTTYLQTHYFPGVPATNATVSKVTRLKQQRIILTLFHYHSCNAAHRQVLVAKARQAAMIAAKPVYLFRALLHYLHEHRIVAPGYSVMQDIVGQALTYEQTRLATVVIASLDPVMRTALNGLLDETPGLYTITQLRHDPKDFSAREIKREIQRGEHLRDLYRLAHTVLPHLGISSESIKYYASLVNYYSVYKLKRFPESTTYLYLLCFVSHRYQRLHDHLLSSLIHHVRRHTDGAKEATKERVYEQRVAYNADVHKAGEVLKLFTDDRIAPQTTFQEVQTHAFTLLERPKIAFVADQLTTQARFDETAWQWEHLDTLAPQFKLHVRPIVLAVEWAAVSGYAPVLEAVDFLKTAWRKGRALRQYAAETFPLQGIPDPMQRYLYAHEADGTRRLLPDRYEFVVYRLLRNGLESGDIFCRDSVRFRSFDDDVLSDQQWQDKERLLQQTGLTSLTQPIREHLATLEHRLETRLLEVNQRIASGENTHFAIIKRGAQVRWTLRYPQSTEPVNHPFFDGLQQADLSQVLHCANQHCRFMEAFEHVRGRYAKHEADDHVIMACVLAWGTNMGLGRMGDISDIGGQALTTASENFLRLETLHGANALLSNAIAALPIFHHYDLGDTLHSSSDGQKFETRIPTINARHSPKYFGLKKGVVSYSLVANHIPINAEIIGANDHESHYVFDLLFNNPTDLRPAIHSTDTHGTNEVNFAILSLFGYQFAPRYRDLYEKVREALYGFKHPSQYAEDLILRPLRTLHPEFVIEEWENIQRIMVSLALKTTTQSIIVRKLSAFARTNKTRRALWEYDNIMRSLYLLEYIDSPPLRRHVQRALNRGENYHQLRRAVSYANFGKLRFKTEQDQQLWGECARLLTNCIIYYNAMLLSHVLAYKEAAGDVQGVALLQYVSPVAWQHLNFYGRYTFRQAPAAINLLEIAQALAHLPVRQVLED